jgi:hypothetical protein
MLKLKKTIRKRIATNNIHALIPSGPESPLAAVEPTIVQLILSMAEIREPLPPSRCIHLINDLIRNTPTQEKLIEFKTKMRMFSPHVPLGEVGLGGKTFERCMLQPKYSTEEKKINSSHREAARVLGSIVSHQDLQAWHFFEGKCYPSK